MTWNVHTLLHRADQQGRTVPLEHAIRIVREIAAALHHVHRRARAVHGKVSPANVWITSDGGVALVDRALASYERGYLAPEAVFDSAVDARADVYALGIVLWELVTGERLYGAGDEVAVAEAVLHVPVERPSRVRIDCPVELDAIALRALEPGRARRYQTARELQRDLDQLVREHRLASAPAGLSRYLRELDLDPGDREVTSVYRRLRGSCNRRHLESH